MEIHEGKTVVITGGSRGIGRAAAELFAREGTALALRARNVPAVASSIKEYEPWLTLSRHRPHQRGLRAPG